MKAIIFACLLVVLFAASPLDKYKELVSQDTCASQAIDAIKPKTPKAGEDGDAPTKACPECDSIVHAAVRQCPDCGHMFPEPQIKIDAKASTLDILSGGPPEWVPVTRVSYARHDKTGKPPSLRVDYWSGLSSHSEWVCIEHQGYARQKAASWWANRAPGDRKSVV